jgi:predicted deacylase
MPPNRHLQFSKMSCFEARSRAPYPDSGELFGDFRNAALALGANESISGESVAGRPLVRFDLGDPSKPVVLLTALMHGVEVIGSLALLEVLRRMRSHPLGERLLRAAHFVVMPIVNPDAFATNLERLGRGDRAWQRCNARGVDLNRNFPRVTDARLLHPFSGSRWRFSPHYSGPGALSEPESQAVHAVAKATRPHLSLAFHSFGNLLLYPWAHTAQQNPRAAEYRSLGSVLGRSLARFPYRVMQARQLYSVLGDMDDWLDTEFGTLAFTVEVSRPKFSCGNWGRVLNPFHWMNPEARQDVVDDLSPGILALMAAAVGVAASA